MEKCPYFGRCGGCSLQHLDDNAYTLYKENLVKEALSHKALPVIPESLIRIPAPTRRRATFAFSNGHFGFNEKQSHKIADIDSCAVLLPELSAFIPTLAKFIKTFNAKGDVFVLMTEWGADIKIDEQKKKSPSLETLERIAEFCNKNNVARLVLNGEPMYQATKLPFPSGAFMQPSKEGEETLIRLVMEAVGDAKKVADLFCGLGTFTKPLAKAGKKVKGYDSAGESVETLAYSGIYGENRDLFRNPLEADELNAFDAVILDPARAGAREQCEKIAESDLKKVVMVSCHLGTFCRDARILVNSGFKIEKLTPVDQFVFSPHLEVVALFSKKNE